LGVEGFTGALPGLATEPALSFGLGGLNIPSAFDAPLTTSGLLEGSEGINSLFGFTPEPTVSLLGETGGAASAPASGATSGLGGITSAIAPTLAVLGGAAAGVNLASTPVSERHGETDIAQAAAPILAGAMAGGPVTAIAAGAAIPIAAILTDMLTAGTQEKYERRIQRAQQGQESMNQILQDLSQEKELKDIFAGQITIGSDAPVGKRPEEMTPEELAKHGLQFGRYDPAQDMQIYQWQQLMDPVSNNWRTLQPDDQNIFYGDPTPRTTPLGNVLLEMAMSQGQTPELVSYLSSLGYAPGRFQMSLGNINSPAELMAYSGGSAQWGPLLQYLQQASLQGL
jgi:hypothetical protein